MNRNIVKKPLPSLLFLVFASVLFGCSPNIKHTAEPLRIGEGKQPAVSVAPDGMIRMVFGNNDSLLYVQSDDNGNSFSRPYLVDTLHHYALGASRGPQIASSRDYTTIVAVDRLGNINAYVLNHHTRTWTRRIRVNDVPEVAKEGFVALATDDANHLYATWLDLRGNHKNKLYFSGSDDGGQQWHKNQLVYQSPEGTVCECCRTSIAVNNQQEVYVMFRNFLHGNRDLYLARSEDGGNSFEEARKLGKGSWPLNACPMDGGGLTVNPQGEVWSVWRRMQTIYVASPGEKEEAIADGRNCDITGSREGNFIAWEKNDSIRYLSPASQQPMTLGAGHYPDLATLQDARRAICVWEQEQQVMAAVINAGQE